MANIVLKFIEPYLSYTAHSVSQKLLLTLILTILAIILNKKRIKKFDEKYLGPLTVILCPPEKNGHALVSICQSKRVSFLIWFRTSRYK